MKDNFFKIIGLMSGTSIDGIDVSLLKTNGEKFFPIDNYFYKYNLQTKKLLSNILENRNEIINHIQKRKRIDQFVSKLHLLALKKSGFLPKSDFVGFHGQTIYHNPRLRKTIQLGDPKMIAKIIKKNVVSDFRSQDISNSGEGAPLAPIFHKAIIEKLEIKLPCCFINIGGIANITFWDGKKLIGFDTGPGNVLLDKYCQRYLEIDYDNEGNIASNGNVDKNFLSNLIGNPYFTKMYPKSIDKLFFEEDFRKLIDLNLSHEDALATLVQLVVESLKISLNILPYKPKSILISGGGAKNTHLKKKILQIFRKFL